MLSFNGLSHIFPAQKNYLTCVIRQVCQHRLALLLVLQKLLLRQDALQQQGRQMGTLK